MSYFSKFQQDIKVSTLNSSTGNITTSSTGFVGLAESTLGVAGIQVSFYADQNCTLYVEQSPDTTPTGPHWDLSDSYTYYANTNFGKTIQAISSYFRVRVVNRGFATTNYFRLQSVLCPIVEPLPRSLDEYGYLKVSTKFEQDLLGYKARNTNQGDRQTVTPVRLVGAIFDGATVDTNFWVVTNTNGGTTTQVASELTVATNTTANGASVITSNRRGRYISGSTNVYRSVLKLSAGVTNNKRRWGVAYGTALPTTPTITDCLLFTFDGTTFSISLLNNTVPATISSGSFNGNLGSTYTPTTGVYHTYEIMWSGSRTTLLIDGEVLHTALLSTTPLTGTLSQYIFMDNVNSSNITSNNTITCRTSSIRRLGNLQTQTLSKYQSGTTAGVICKYGPGNLHSLVISPTTNNAVVTIYDGTTTGGTVIWASGSLNTSTSTNPFSLDLGGIPFYNGLFFTITVANCNLLVIYE